MFLIFLYGICGRILMRIVGIYSLTWIFQILYHIVPDSERGEPRISSQITKYPRTGCDEMTTVLLNFPSGAHGIATTSLRVSYCHISYKSKFYLL